MDESIRPLVIEIMVGIEALIFCLICLGGVRVGKKLNDHLKGKHPDIFQRIKVPFMAGGSDVLSQHYRSLKTLYFSNMPDQISSQYQIKLRIFAITGITWFLIFCTTMVCIRYFLF